MTDRITKTNNSQYSGTTKNSICGLCGINLNNKNADQQEQHLIDCQNKIDKLIDKINAQRKLF